MTKIVYTCIYIYIYYIHNYNHSIYIYTFIYTYTYCDFNLCHMVLPESIRVSANIHSCMAAEGFHTSTDVIFRRAIGPEGVVPLGAIQR